MRVLCIDDKHLPQGAEIASGKDYEVEDFFINNWGEKTYIIKGIKNEGLTDKGLGWHGYSAKRFAIMENEPVLVEQQEESFILN